MLDGLSDLIRTLLERRGITDEASARAFLSPDFEAHTHSPLLFAGMDAALERVFRAMKQGERIAIYGDFDCDGIPGTAVLLDVFAKAGYSAVEPYIPHRDKEGYGFHQDAIRSLGEKGVTLIITVDVGTTAVESVRYASTLGIDVIVTDHHEIPGELPDAVAVLNPKRAPYPFPHLCGAGVAFKFAQAILAEGRARGEEAFAAIPLGWEKWLLDLVAIATVADMVPLQGENRVLAYWGLQVLRKSRRPGITALCAALRIRKAEITEDDIGFSIAPRINAASRMDDPDLALRLLTTQDTAEAEDVARRLEKLNQSRKGVVGAIVREASRRMRDRFTEGEHVVVIGDPDWKPSLLGLAANSLMEERGGLVCLWGRDGNGRIKGSCRSDGSLSVVDLFVRSGVFEEAGGHAASGGFSVSHERVHDLAESLNATASMMDRLPPPERAAAVDSTLALREVTAVLLQEIAQLSPYGIGNPKPVFRIVDVAVAEMKRFGKEGNHLELALVCRRSGMRMRAFDFFRSPSDLSHQPGAGEAVALLAHVERDSFRGGVCLRLVDVVPA